MLDLVLLRHGQSTWNAENLFTGWVDVDLTEVGEAEAIAGGKLLAAEPGLDLRLLHTSVLTRAIHTAELALGAAKRSWLPVRRDWRLNERHYGDLQGKNKKETAEKFGKEQLQLWRRSYDTPPPPLSPDNPTSTAHDPRYRDIDPSEIPTTECLADVVRTGPPLLGVSHRARPTTDGREGWRSIGGGPRQQHPRPAQTPRGNLRRRHRRARGADGHSVPLLLEDDLTVHSSQFLGDPAAAAAAAAAVGRQAG